METCTNSSWYLQKRRMLKPYYTFKKAINFLSKRLSSHGTPILKGWNADYIKVPAATLIPREYIGTQTKLFASIFLSRYSGSEFKFEELYLDKLLRETIGVLSLEFRAGLAYLNTLAAFGSFDMLKYETTQQKVIEDAFVKLKRYRVFIPNNMNPHEYGEYMSRFIKEITT
jgi:hypothetical protein